MSNCEHGVRLDDFCKYCVSAGHQMRRGEKPLTEADVRRIVREELAAIRAEAMVPQKAIPENPLQNAHGEYE